VQRNSCLSVSDSDDTPQAPQADASDGHSGGTCAVLLTMPGVTGDAANIPVLAEAAQEAVGLQDGVNRHYTMDVESETAVAELPRATASMPAAGCLPTADGGAETTESEADGDAVLSDADTEMLEWVESGRASSDSSDEAGVAAALVTSDHRGAVSQARASADPSAVAGPSGAVAIQTVGVHCAAVRSGIAAAVVDGGTAADTVTQAADPPVAPDAVNDVDPDNVVPLSPLAGVVPTACISDATWSQLMSPDGWMGDGG